MKKRSVKNIKIILSALLLFTAGFWNPAFGSGIVWAETAGVALTGAETGGTDTSAADLAVDSAGDPATGNLAGTDASVADLAVEGSGDTARPYIVVFEQSPVRSLRSLSFSSVADPATLVKEQLQDQIKESYPLIDGALVDLTAEQAESLASEPGVAFVEPDYPVHALSQTVPWGVEEIYEEEIYPFDTWTSTSGAGIRVAVLDSGIQGTHEDLPALAGGITTVDSSLYYVDGNGHGTHVAGIVAAQMNDIGVVGVAPAATLYSVKVLDSSGDGSITGIINGIQWAVNNDIDIISMSLGTESYSVALENACNAAYADGLLLIAAAGNSGNASGTGINMEYPAMFDSVIAVGATDSANDRADFSSTGAELELMAPGQDISSTCPSSTLMSSADLEDDEYTYTMSSTYLIESGVGMVTAPVVYCGEAADAATISAALNARGIAAGTDWIALIDRKDTTFAQKVLLSMNQGAKAAIIANNNTAEPDNPGTFTLDDGVTVKPGSGWVPTISISYNAGQMINGSATLRGTVEVKYNSYKTMSGTSMATPHVSGAAAVIWAAAPSLSNVQIREILQSTALDLGLLQSQQGYGLIQLNAALDLAVDMESGSALALAPLETSLRNDTATGHLEADLEFRIMPGAGVQGQVFFALYDSSGRMITCRLYSVNILEYKQALTVAADYDPAYPPAKMKAFLVTGEYVPLGGYLEVNLP